MVEVEWGKDGIVKLCLTSDDRPACLPSKWDPNRHEGVTETPGNGSENSGDIGSEAWMPELSRGVSHT